MTSVFSPEWLRSLARLLPPFLPGSLHSICPLALGFLTPSPALLLPLFRGWVIQRISCVSTPGLIPKGWEEQSGPEISLLLEGLRKVTDMT